MNLTTDHTDDIAMVRVGESRLMYPLLSEFSATVAGLIDAGEHKLVIEVHPDDTSAVKSFGA